LTLSERAWRHIRVRHPELSDYRSLIREALANPELVFRGAQEERKAVKFFVETHLGPKYLVVVFRQDADGRKAIITAYFTSDLKRIKGELIWKA